MSDMELGWQLMAYGLAGVFSVLILLWGTIRLLLKVFPYRETISDPDDK